MRSEAAGSPALGHCVRTGACLPRTGGNIHLQAIVPMKVGQGGGHLWQVDSPACVRSGMCAPHHCAEPLHLLLVGWGNGEQAERRGCRCVQASVQVTSACCGPMYSVAIPTPNFELRSSKRASPLWRSALPRGHGAEGSGTYTSAIL